MNSTAKARFIIRPDALRVKNHKPLPPLENEVSSPTMTGKVSVFEDQVETNRKALLENRRDLQMIESDMNRFHRQ